MAQDPLMQLWASAHEDEPCCLCRAVTAYFWVLRLVSFEDGQRIYQYLKICKECGIMLQEIAPTAEKLQEYLFSKTLINKEKKK